MKKFTNMMYYFGKLFQKTNIRKNPGNIKKHKKKR